MNCKDRNESAAPKRSGHFQQCNKKKHRRDRVQQDIGEMMASCFNAVQLAVQHVRDGGQRMPVHGMNMGERPGSTADTEPAGYFCIFIDITRIIIVNEVVPEGLAKYKPHEYHERKADTDS